MLQTYQEKLALLVEMINFSVVDGVLHDKEYQFLKLVAQQLHIKDEDFLALFQEELKPVPIRSEFQRIQHLYRLALLMFSDGVMHEKQLISLKQLGINMGLNPAATHKMILQMQTAEHHMLGSDVLMGLFRAQHN